MNPLVPITLETLEAGLQWSSSGAPYESEALLSRTTGDLFFKSMHGNFAQELPEDLDDRALYIAVPHKNELDLGKNLALTFVQGNRPGLSGAVSAMFRQRGAYSKFKALLECERLLDTWYEFENLAMRKALVAWAHENGFFAIEGKNAA